MTDNHEVRADICKACLGKGNIRDTFSFFCLPISIPVSRSCEKCHGLGWVTTEKSQNETKSENS